MTQIPTVDDVVFDSGRLIVTRSCEKEVPEVGGNTFSMAMVKVYYSITTCGRIQVACVCVCVFICVCGTEQNNHYHLHLRFLQAKYTVSVCETWVICILALSSQPRGL